MFSVTSDCSEQDTSVHGRTPLSNFVRSNKEKMFWGWVEDEFGNVIDINCPYCNILIHHTFTGRMMCPKCGRSVGDHNKQAIDADLVLDRSFISDSKFFRQAKDANRIPGRPDKGSQPKANPERRTNQETTGRRAEFHATSRP